MQTMKKMMTVIAVVGLVLALAPAAQAATVTWTGAVDNNWSTVTGGTSGYGNWDGDPTPANTILVLSTDSGDSTSILDFDTDDTWALGATTVGLGHTLVLATGAVLTSTDYGTSWAGTVKFEGGTLGSPWAQHAGPYLKNASSVLEFHAGTFEDGNETGDPTYIYFVNGLIHVVGKTAGSNFNPAYFRKANLDNASFQFTLVDGEGVDKIALSSTGNAFRDDHDGTGPVTLTVDGIQDYLDGGGTQSEWVLMTSAMTAANSALDLTLVQTGPVDGGLGTVTATYNEVKLTIVPEPATMSLLALGGLGVLLKRRRRRA